jgi:hypothetical protein
MDKSTIGNGVAASTQTFSHVDMKDDGISEMATAFETLHNSSTMAWE